MEPLPGLPGIDKVLVLRCRTCGFERTCRPGWRVRCHVCLDERTRDVPIWRIGGNLLKELSNDGDARDEARQFLELGEREPITVRGAAEFCAARALEDELDKYKQPGWTVLAGDVHGLPWFGRRELASSHGTWGYHDACRTLQKMAQGALDCVTCGPEPGSRTHLARRDDPYLLYLVRYRNRQKFGVGDHRRVRAHQRRGAEVVHVLAARHADVMRAEAILKRRYRTHTMPPAIPDMPITFGSGTEVLPEHVLVDLTQVLADARDVTHRFTSPEN
jgi:hypothetical protein